MQKQGGEEGAARGNEGWGGDAQLEGLLKPRWLEA